MYNTITCSQLGEFLSGTRSDICLEPGSFLALHVPYLHGDKEELENGPYIVELEVKRIERDPHGNKAHFREY